MFREDIISAILSVITVPWIIDNENEGGTMKKGHVKAKGKGVLIFGVSATCEPVLCKGA